MRALAYCSPFHPRDLSGLSVQRLYGNPQTDAFLELLGLQHRVTVPFDQPEKPAATVLEAAISDENEIDLDDLDDDSSDEENQCVDDSAALVEQAFASGIVVDENEIDLDDDDSAVGADEVVTKPPVASVPKRKRIKLPPPVNT